jgi:hypothetical protein
MIDLNKPFTISQAGQELQVQPRKTSRGVLFFIRFQDGRLPLVITRAHGEHKPVFWTSVPEGRQREAEQIGPAITAHYQAIVSG